MKLSKFQIMLIVSMFFITINTAQDSNLKACCKNKGGIELCCNKDVTKNISNGCKGKGGTSQCCAKGKQTNSTAAVNNTSSNTQSLPACCVNRANQKRSFWDKLLGRKKDLPACCANK